ncbi:MAG: glycosyltransferase [Chthoniobacterales bacterium]|nr:glycosyltransferase [Chthoniobacterales bacterium]
MSAKVSIFVPVCNGREYLPDCLESIVQQKEVRLQVIVRDDESEDGSMEICKEFQRNFLEVEWLVERNSSRSGMVANWNACLRVSDGEYKSFGARRCSARGGMFTEAS